MNDHCVVGVVSKKGTVSFFFYGEDGVMNTNARCWEEIIQLLALFAKEAEKSSLK